MKEKGRKRKKKEEKGIGILSTLRVISGIYKGRRLISPSTIRPTKDIVKEALFSMLATLSGKTFIDLYAGSGSIGIEALSRGALMVYFIEQSTLCTQSLNANIKNLSIEKSKVEVVIQDVLSYSMDGKKAVDYIYADPPYNRDLSYYQNLINKTKAFLKKDGMLILEHPTKLHLKELENEINLKLGKTRRYGISQLSFFIK